MAKIINLRIHRRQAARDAGRQAAAENAARHGRARDEKAREAAEADKAARTLDGHRRDPPAREPD